jgi:hypothetical protein
MTRKSGIVLIVLALCALVPALSGHGREPKELKDLMRDKLKNSQGVLEGVTLGDFDKIIEHGDKLLTLSKDMKWKVVQTPRYEIYSNQFRRSVEDLIDKAKEKNLDGAALSYMEVTLSCVKCHKYMREVRTASLDRE